MGNMQQNNDTTNSMHRDYAEKLLQNETYQQINKSFEYDIFHTSLTQKHESISCSLWTIFIASGASLPADEMETVSGLPYSIYMQTTASK